MTAVDSTGHPTPTEEDRADRRQRRLEQFHPAYRRFIAELTCCGGELEDLADSFPALLFALVSGYATPGRRERCAALVAEGAPLREAADAIGLPLWLRKLPAGVFADPLPVFPDDPAFAFRISNLIPREARLLPAWLRHVGHGLETAGPAYALWLARQPDLTGPSEEHFLYMAAWAWFSGRPGLLGHHLLRRPWRPEMSFRRGRDELAAWRQRLRLIECLGPGIESPWLADGSASGFEFVALRTVDDFIAESEALENCLDQYADQLHTGLTAVFSIRKGARRVACVEIGLHDEEASMPTIVQLRGQRNRRAPPEVWQATFTWLGGQHLAAPAPLQQAPKPTERAEARRQLWQPYLDFLAGTRHEPVFRRLVMQQLRKRTHDGRRARLLPQRVLHPPATADSRRPDPAPPSPAAATARPGT